MNDNQKELVERCLNDYSGSENYQKEIIRLIMRVDAEKPDYSGTMLIFCITAVIIALICS